MYRSRKKHILYLHNENTIKFNDQSSVKPTNKIFF